MGRRKSAWAIVGICATELSKTSRMNSPIGSGQILDFLEMAISGNKYHPVTFRRGGNPDVVLGKRPPFLLQVMSQFPVFACYTEVG